MDLVLEVCDKYAFDYLFAYIAPVPALDVNGSPSGQQGNGNNSFASGNAAALLNSKIVDSYDTYFSFAAHPSVNSLIPRDNIFRQFFSLWVTTVVFGYLLYFFFASLSYFFIYDKQQMKHPKFVKNQIWLEIKLSVLSMPVMAIMTVLCFLAEVRGYSKLYMNVSDYGWFYLFFQFPLFIMFTDMLIYMIHRGLHHPSVYRSLHKPHHKWIVPTPYASHAFHPLDGFSQSIPYHVFPFIFPLNKVAYLVLFLFVNIWTILIHDGEYLMEGTVVNSSAHHTMHHLYFNYNYGQFLTLWDRIGGSHKEPDRELFDKETKMSEKTWDEQSNKMSEIQEAVEGKDDRVYISKKDN